MTQLSYRLRLPTLPETLFILLGAATRNTANPPKGYRNGGWRFLYNHILTVDKIRHI